LLCAGLGVPAGAPTVIGPMASDFAAAGEGLFAGPVVRNPARPSPWRPLSKENMVKLRLIGSVAAAVALVLGVASPAFGQDCFIVNRSDQGNAGASNSQAWITLTVDDFAHSPDFPPGFDPDCFVSYWLAHGGPNSFTIRTTKIIGEGSSNPNLANGKGLDHIEDAYGALIGEALGACPA